MKRLTFLLTIFLLAACASPSDLKRPTLPPDDSGEPDGSADSGAIQPASQPPDLPNKGPAPELNNEVWLNVDEPLRLADLRGKVVALDMWTFG